jgi:hypothetical protein
MSKEVGDEIRVREGVLETCNTFFGPQAIRLRGRASPTMVPSDTCCIDTNVARTDRSGSQTLGQARVSPPVGGISRATLQ